MDVEAIPFLEERAADGVHDEASISDALGIRKPWGKTIKPSGEVECVSQDTGNFIFKARELLFVVGHPALLFESLAHLAELCA